MRKLWCIKGHDDEDKEDDDIDNDSGGLETPLGTVKDKQCLVGKQKCFNCGKIGHRSAKTFPQEKERTIGKGWRCSRCKH